MKKIIVCLLAVLGFAPAYRQMSYEGVDVKEFVDS